MLVALLSAAGAGVAQAQIVASAAFDSDYVVRGVSLDGGRPYVRFGLAYDHASGLYAGLSGLVADTAHEGIRPLGYVGFAGYARRLKGELSIDVGVSDTGLTLYLPAPPRQAAVYAAPVGPGQPWRYRADYLEAYAGLTFRDFVARLYVSPDYLNQGVRTAYLDLTQTFRISDRVHLYAHAGALTPLSGADDPRADRERFDIGAGGALTWRHAEVRLGWSGSAPTVYYPTVYRQGSSHVVIGVTGFF